MNEKFVITIKKVATDIFRENKYTIINEWIKRVEEEGDVKAEEEMNILRSGFEKLVNDFIKYLSVGDFDSYYQSNEVIASSFACNDISFEKFIDIFHLFEDSYLILLEELPSKVFREYITEIDRLHHKTMAIVTKKYFDIRDNMVFVITQLIELRDAETAEHLERTRQYTTMISRALGQDIDFIKSIYKASMLHDIGKVAVKDDILLKPGKLTFEEFEEIKKHTVVGAKTIDSIIREQNIQRGYLPMARDIALYHHEKFDGGGYPEGLKNEQIPISARILALVDAYDTIVSKRPYKEPLSHEEAVRRIVVDSGKHFDPVVVGAFLRIQEEFKKVNWKDSVAIELNH